MDHQDTVPFRAVQILRGHDNEVTLLKFSHNGKYLASSSSDLSVVIWELRDTGKFTRLRSLRAHTKYVSCISWSPNDEVLATCGYEEALILWDVMSWEYFAHYNPEKLGISFCGWGPKGDSIFTVVGDRSIRMWDLHANELRHWTNQTTIGLKDFVMATDGEEFMTIHKRKVILLHKWVSGSQRFIEEDEYIISLELSEDNKFLLVGLYNQELHLWKICDDIEPELVMKYRGYTQSACRLRSCFGGPDQTFIASGSEDSQVYMWNRASGELISNLGGHRGIVRCVSWNPLDPRMFASAGTDRTIRIWGNSDYVALVVPVEFDWRTHPCMQFPIRDQGKFGMCWAIVVADVITCILKITYPDLEDFVASPQELIEGVIRMKDSVTIYSQAHNDGKRIGEYSANLDSAFLYCERKGVTLESSFGYLARRTNRTIPKLPRILLKSWTTLNCASKEDIRRAICNQPVIGSMLACDALHGWRGDIAKRVLLKNIIDPTKTYDQHVVLIVGYGETASGEEFYIIRNSWSSEWGDAGYAKVSTKLITPRFYHVDLEFQRE